MDAIEFTPPPPPQYAGGCTTEPAFFALNHFATWRTDVTVNGEPHRAVELLPLLKAISDEPERYGVSQGVAWQAVERFIDSTAPLLEREGGERAWLEREFQPGH